MSEPKVGRPHWPDAVSKPSDDLSALKPWKWAVARLEKSHNYWIATSRPDGRPHLMIIWGIWWDAAFWFSTGPKTRKAKNIAAQPYCIFGTENADEAIIVEGTAVVIADRADWRRMADIYDKKYGGKLMPLLESSGGNVYRIEPKVAFGQDEHAEDFVQAATRWTF